MIQKLYLIHHGIKDQRWGVRNGPPYPLSDEIKKEQYDNTNGMNPEAYKHSKELQRRYGDGIRLPGKEKEYVFELLDNNLTDDEKKNDSLVSCSSQYYNYKAVNLGHNKYIIISKKGIDGRKVTNADVNETLTEMFGVNWEDYDEPV